ncbi:hypothetical protein DFO57_101625 [Pantoea sp. AG702]|nr:hypothetical protein DFO57_101625 [Pantoea sp. AG702]
MANTTSDLSYWSNRIELYTLKNPFRISINAYL